jgi:hypothetical protein
VKLVTARNARKQGDTQQLLRAKLAYLFNAWRLAA